MKRILVPLLLAVLVFPLTSQDRRPLTFDDLIGMERISDPQISPDGATVAFVVTYHNKTENTVNSNIYLVSVNGGAIRQLTTAPRSNASPRWMPDGKGIAFISTRDGESQIWSIPVTGGEARKVSTLSTGAGGLVVSRDGRWLAFASDVFPDCESDDCNKRREEEIAKSKVKAKVFTNLPYRVWNYWKDGKRSHLFVMPPEGGVSRDLTPGDYDTPPIDLGGHQDYDISPDGKEVVFTRNTDSMIATSTNNDLFVVPIGGGPPKRITDNPANDSQPLYSPDGRYIAYRKMDRAGFEADRNQLVVYARSTGAHTILTKNFDRSVDDVVWAPDSRSLYFTSDDRGNKAIFRVPAGGGTVDTLVNRGYNHSPTVSPDGKTLVFIKEAIHAPAEVYRMDSNGKNLRQLTSINADRVAKLEMHPREDFWFSGAGGTRVHGFFVKPPGFDPAKKYPVVYLVHGGPQGQWGDQFHYRWNAQMFAARGYVAVLINPRGSTGYGQTFTDEISGDWGGKVYEDLMNGVDFLVTRYPFVDANRIAAAGASYGGYMMNWMAGNTDRFRCLVNHDGVFNPKSMYGTTEELWFPEWEFGGTPYRNPELYEQWSPLNHAHKFSTPTLVIHGQLDYRVDVSEGFQLFTALQRQGVPSKMLYFPDEGHWVMKPANAEFWWQSVLDWIDEHTLQ
ncbi:MAG: S9 family peptidase [Bacteroidota bacterium]